MGTVSYHIIRWVLGLIFLYSGIVKLMDLASFAIIIEAYGFLPEMVTMPAAVGLAVMEIVVGAGTLLDIRGALALLGGMLLFFIAILGYGIMMGLDIDCGCFGPEDPEGQAYAGLRPALYRDLVMVWGVATLYFLRMKNRHFPKSMGHLCKRFTREKEI